MYLVKISCVLLAVLGTLNNCGVNGALQPASPSHQSTASVGAAQLSANSYHGQDKGYQKQPTPPQYQEPSLQPRTPVTAVPFEQFFRPNKDGTYEYRHALPNGGLRYEQSYKVPYQNTEIFVVRGFYTYQLPDGKYLTVFYTGDQNGFRQTSTTITLRLPEVPRL